MAQKNHESRRKYCATHASICLLQTARFACALRCAQSFAFLLIHPISSSWECLWFVCGLRRNGAILSFASPDKEPAQNPFPYCDTSSLHFFDFLWMQTSIFDQTTICLQMLCNSFLFHHYHYHVHHQNWGLITNNENSLISLGPMVVLHCKSKYSAPLCLIHWRLNMWLQSRQLEQ